MGYYINPGGNTGKAQKLVEMYNAEIIEQPKTFLEVPKDKALICVVENDGWDAAGVCVDEREFLRFKAPDVINQGNRTKMTPFGEMQVFDINPTHQRNRTWLLMEKSKAFELSGYRE